MRILRGLLAALVSTGILLACGRAAEEAAPPHLIVITLDTVRADHLGCYGYLRATTPNLDALAEESLLFEQCLSPVSQTLPSHTSLFTGLQPYEHGVLSNKEQGTQFVPAPGAPALAQVLAGAGFRTAAFVAAEPVKRGGGLERGFQHWWQPESNQVRAQEVVQHAIEWIGDGLQQPTMIWVHLFDAHAPYDAPAPYAGRFEADQDLARHLNSRRVSLEIGRGETREEVFDSYDGELAYLDAQVGRLLDHLRSSGDLDEAVLVVTGDHGEGLLQHARGGHSWIWREMHHVPFLLRAPGLAAGRQDAALGMRDVLPCALAAAPALSELAGEWLRLASGRSHLAAEVSEPVFGQLPGRGQQADFVEYEGWRLVVGLGQDRLFRLDRDPHELRNLSKRETEKRAELSGLIEAEKRRAQEQGLRFGAGKTRAMDPERVKGLEALGYGGDADEGNQAPR